MVSGPSGLAKMTAQDQDKATSQFTAAISLIEKHRARPTPDQVAAARDLSLFVKSFHVRYPAQHNILYRSNLMDAISYTAARTNLAKTMEKVCEDHSPVIITRSKSHSVVMISLEDYEALQETAYLLRAPKNARRLLESVAELEQGGGQEKELLE
jgi:antitoxin YefM